MQAFNKNTRPQPKQNITMRKNKIVFIGRNSLAIIFLIASSASSYSQYVQDYKKSADAYYAKGDYYSAAVYYEKFLGGGDKSKGGSTEPYTIQKKSAATAAAAKNNDNYEEIAYRIAESYRSLNDHSRSEKWYAEAVKFDKAKYPNAAYWYGVTLRANGKYAEAQQQLETYLQSGKKDFTEQAKLELADVKFIQDQLNRKDASLYNVSKYGAGVNTQGANYAASWNGNTMFFTSTRPDSALLTNKKKSPYVNALYISEGGSAEKATVPAASNMEQGVAALSPDGNRIYLTRWISKQGQNAASIYMSQKTNGAWSEPVKMGAEINVEEYNSQQPYVSPDGKYLLFASNRPGGSGKFDLWYAPLNANGEAGKAVNFGKSINTKEDDQAPFYHQSSGNLVFASKGRIGMGGYDLYQSKGTIGGSWQEPQNLGAPVNSNKDDIYFTAKGASQLLKDASFSSDRSSACCLELFSVAKTYKKYISGVVTDCTTQQPISASVSLSTPAKLISSTNGKFLYEVDEFAASQITASKDSYNNASIALTTPTSDADTLYNANLCLTPVEVVEPPVVTPETNVQPKTPKVALFDFAMYDLRAETKSVLDTLAALLKREPMLGIEITGYTDKRGTDGYNLKLSELRAMECKNYLLGKGINADRIQTKALGECCTLENETTTGGKDNPKARQANRRVEFKILIL
jgi:OOP family OmpA-OmpF porin